jgi:hypothetical protein
MKKIVLVLSLTALGWSDFTRDDSAEIVTDNDTGFQWEDQQTIVSKKWEDAIDYCENLTLGGFDDWRLPNINELRSIVDYERSDPAIDRAFRNTKSDWYWTSTKYNRGSLYSWELNFSYGYDSYSSQSYSRYVRCLR